MIVTLFVILSSLGAKDLSLERTIEDIYHTLKSKKELLFNTKYINNKTGVYLIYRLGMCDRVEHLDKVSLTPKSELTFLSIQNTITTIPKGIKYKKITYSCDKEAWSDDGYFIYKVNKIDLLSNAQNYKKNTLLEKDLYYFIDTINDTSFYLKEIDGLWYILLLDEVSGDCGA